MTSMLIGALAPTRECSVVGQLLHVVTAVAEHAQAES
jgi:hypothetical protein